MARTIRKEASFETQTEFQKQKTIKNQIDKIVEHLEPKNVWKNERKYFVPASTLFGGRRRSKYHRRSRFQTKNKKRRTSRR
jgi:hypothetical protein